MKVYVLLTPDWNGPEVHSVHKTLESADNTTMEYYRNLGVMLQMYESELVE